ncbi:MAG: hypothetical protein IJO29_07825 [Oscillospiraceae bacterium]|nr:hypothetical protein [Oscillospiraceae bacterium]
MIRINNIKAPLDFDNAFLLDFAAKELKTSCKNIHNLQVARKSVDARKKDNICFNLAINVQCENEYQLLKKHAKSANISKQKIYEFAAKESKLKKRPVIVGFGPAGIFAAYILALCGADPIVLERGQDIDSRAESVNNFSKNGNLNTESNIQFGEGGAGAFSDGKLNTGTNDEKHFFILKTLNEFGAPDDILINAKPHVGTDKLRITIKNMRKRIIELGGEIIFNAKFTEVVKNGSKLCAVKYIKNGQTETIQTDHCILALGHSARDVFEYLYKSGIEIIQKSFAVGVRIEHLAQDINEAMYGRFANHPKLGAADYKTVAHTNQGRTMYSFCMCPGGVVVPAASEENSVVTNGMSNFARDEVNSNSALLVGISPADIGDSSPLAAMEFQRRIERAAFLSANSSYAAPINLVGDFLKSNTSKKLGSIKPSYMPSTEFALPDSYLPEFVCDTLRQGISITAEKIKGFDRSDAILTGVESRSSSPVRIVRDESLCSTSLKGLYPCGEGAGYAGGIMSAASDGIRCALAVLESEK